MPIAPFRPRASARTAASALLMALAACGGDGGGSTDNDSASAPTISGTAAVGAPLSAGVLRVVDATGAVVADQVALQADGRFSGVRLVGTGPWTLEACGYAGAHWTCVYSVAQRGGTTHVTPLTSALVLLATGRSPEALPGAGAGVDPTALTTALTVALPAAQEALRGALAPMLADAGLSPDVDLFGGELVAGSRMGHDRLLDAVQVHTGVDGVPFVQLASRLGGGTVYLTPGAPALGALSADAAAVTLPLAGLQTLFARMSAAIASAEACAHPGTGLATTLAADASLSLGGAAAAGADDVALTLCGLLGGDTGGNTLARWGSTFVSPVLGRCDFEGADPVCSVSVTLRDAEGGIQTLGEAFEPTVAVVFRAGQWWLKGDRLALPIRAGARVQRDLRFDTATPVIRYRRTITIEIPAVPGLACARVSQRDAAGQPVTLAFFKPHGAGGTAPERLSLWSTGAQRHEPSLNALAGATHSGDERWVELPAGEDGDATIRRFHRGGRSLLVDLFSDADCATPTAHGSRSRFDVELSGVPPVSSALAALPWPELGDGSKTALRQFSTTANAVHTLDTAWGFALGPMAVSQVAMCSDRARCGEGDVGRIGHAAVRSVAGAAARSAAVRVQSPFALRAGDWKMIALSGRNGDGLGLESNFLSCPATPAGQPCLDGDVQVAKPR
jgi:hypothetical protein